MFKLNEFFGVLDQAAPLKYSKMQIEQGAYDNSGIIVNMHDYVEKVLFSLDLSTEAVKRAKRLKCDTVVTHHPAIYYPVKSLSVNGETAAVALAAKNGLNVISMHLNLDVATDGIDDNLCKGLGGKNYRFLNGLDDNAHYGREFAVGKPLGSFKREICESLGTRKVLVYGSLRKEAGVAASFCGGGADYAIKYVREGGTADTIITSEMAHHVLKEMIESGKSVILIPHYASENYGFKIFSEKIGKKVSPKAQTFFFEDKRFL